MTTISDAFAAADASSTAPPQSERAGVHAHARARVARQSVTIKRVWRVVSTDVRSAWVWSDSPPSLTELVKGRAPTADQVPAGHGGFRKGWWVYNHVVAIPATAFIYFALWVVQHPARFALAVALTAPLVITYLAL